MQGPLSATPSVPSVYQVSAVMQTPPTEPSSPTEPPLEEELDEQTPIDPEPSRSNPTRLGRAQQAQPTAQEAEPAPPDESPPPVEDFSAAPSQEPPPPGPSKIRLEVSDSRTGPAQSTPTVGASSRGRQASQSGGTGSSRRGARSGSSVGGGGDTCRQVADVLVRRLHVAAPYPSWARSVGLEGRLELTLRVGRDGHPRGVRVVRSSGHEGLDRYALSAARGLGGLPEGCPRSINIPVTYRRR